MVMIMADYYVIRNKNTGFYFRGKGVNRWGKYFNQASIYRRRSMAESSMQDVAWRGEETELVPIQIVENAVDAIEVVRCKDCKWFKLHKLACVRPYHNGITGIDDFCSRGERKEK